MGDEVGALVFDFGTYSLRGGFAGEDTPKLDIPSVLSVKEEENQKKVIIGPNITVPREKYDLQPFLRDGLIEDFDNFEKVVSYMIDFLIPGEKANHPILLSEPVWNTKPKREKTAEILFEQMSVPAMYIDKNAALTCFANGRHTGLVLDCGAVHSTAVPVFDGLVLTQATVRSPLGGDFILRQCQKFLETFQFDIVPSYKVATKEPVKERDNAKWTSKKTLPNVSETFDAYIKKMLLTDFLSSVVQISDEHYDQAQAETFPMVNYEFPNGYNIDLGYERFQLAEPLFDPSLLPEAGGNSMLSMSHTITSSASLCDIDLRPSLYSNILVVGGNSSLMGFGDRLQKDLNSKTPASMRVKICIPGTLAEKRFSSWIGGSILASLGTFQQMWISKQEYEELGKACVEKKMH